jgi:hypothetical protein
VEGTGSCYSCHQVQERRGWGSCRRSPVDIFNAGVTCNHLLVVVACVREQQPGNRDSLNTERKEGWPCEKPWVHDWGVALHPPCGLI